MADESKTVVIVGSGSAGFAAAIAAKEAGLEPIIVEAPENWGAHRQCRAAGHGSRTTR